MTVAKWYGPAAEGLFNGRPIHWLRDPIYVALLTDEYRPDQDAHKFVSDLHGEVQAHSYARKLLEGKTIRYSDTAREVRMDADDCVWDFASFACRYAVVLRDTGRPAADPVIGYVDFGEPQTVFGGTFTIEWHADGVMAPLVL